MHSRAVVCGLVLLGVCSLPVSAQPAKDIVIEGQVKVGVHKFKLDSGNLYQFEVKAKGFLPGVTMVGGPLSNTADFFKEQNTFRSLFLPTKNQEYTLTIIPTIGFGTPPIPEGVLDYTVTVKTMKVDETPVLKKEDKLVATDPKYANPQAFNKTHFKAYPIKMKMGQLYIIEMNTTRANGGKLDPYLYLENAGQMVLARDDDGGGFPNARLLFRAPADGEHTIIATGLSDSSALGDYTLLVRTVSEAK